MVNLCKIEDVKSGIVLESLGRFDSSLKEKISGQGNIVFLPGMFVFLSARVVA